MDISFIILVFHKHKTKTFVLYAETTKLLSVKIQIMFLAEVKEEELENIKKLRKQKNQKKLGVISI